MAVLLIFTKTEYSLFMVLSQEEARVDVGAPVKVLLKAMVSKLQ